MKAELSYTDQKLRVRLLPETKFDVAYLEALVKVGHHHFTLGRVSRADAGRVVNNPPLSVMLEPSYIEWSRPETRYDRRLAEQRELHLKAANEMADNKKARRKTRRRRRK